MPNALCWRINKMKISFECGRSTGACCKGKHVAETTKVYGANDYYVGKLRFVELC